MNEVLFRGKCISTGEWVEGALLPCDDGTMYIATSMLDPPEDGGPAMVACHLVYGNTVCRYTGLKDKNDKRIFEGDIYTWRDDYNDYHACLICFGEYFDRGANRYATMANGFYLKTLKGETFNFAGSGYSEIEIAGNIFDNFNLLEERK